MRSCGYVLGENVMVFSSFSQSGLKRLARDVFFEVLDQLRDSVRVGPGFAAVVTGPEPVGVVSLIDKGVVGFNEFLYRRPETAATTRGRGIAFGQRS
jgi:hypothetical protein